MTMNKQNQYMYTDNKFVKYMIETLRPTLGETIYDPRMMSGSFLLEAIKYLNNTYQDICWKRLYHTINGTFEINECVNIANNMIFKETNVDFSNNIIQNDSIYNITTPFDIIVSEIPTNSIYELNEFYYILSLIKQNGRGAFLVEDKFLYDNTSKYVEMRKNIIENYNIVKISSISSTDFAIPVSILFITNNKRNSNEVHNMIDFYNMFNVDGILEEVYDISLTYNNIKSNNYILSRKLLECRFTNDLPPAKRICV